MSQIFLKRLSFCLMKSRKKSFKNALQSNVFDISKQFQYRVYNINREILGYKIKVNKIE